VRPLSFSPFATAGTLLKILIRNLARDVTQEELLALFTAHGRVQSCTIVMDSATGGSKGFGFANMPVPHEAKAAIRALNNLELHGSRLRVKKAEAPAQIAAQSAEQTAAQEPAVTAGVADGNESGQRLKKDGTPLGPRKARVFRKKS
jgi:RNA recognition motif-containing protein